MNEDMDKTTTNYNKVLDSFIKFGSPQQKHKNKLLNQKNKIVSKFDTGATTRSATTNKTDPRGLLMRNTKFEERRSYVNSSVTGNTGNLKSVNGTSSINNTNNNN